MLMNQILSPTRTLAKVRIHSKKRLLEFISEEVAREIPGANSTDIFNAFVSREKLGSTALGAGIAIPHCRVKECKNIMGFFIQLDSGIDFDASDGELVDLFFALVVPLEANDEHLRVLSEIAYIFDQSSVLSRLRSTHDTNQLHNIISSANAA